jgi:hypothetical protein
MLVLNKPLPPLPLDLPPSYKETMLFNLNKKLPSIPIELMEDIKMSFISVFFIGTISKTTKDSYFKIKLSLISSLLKSLVNYIRINFINSFIKTPLSILGLTIIKKDKGKNKEVIGDIEDGLSSPVGSINYDGISTNTSFTDPEYKSRITQALDNYFKQFQTKVYSEIETNTEFTDPTYKQQIQNAINNLMIPSKVNDNDIIYETTTFNNFAQHLSSITESENDFGSIINRFSHLALNNFNGFTENDETIDSNDSIVIKPESIELRRRLSLFSSRLFELCVNKPLPPLPYQSADLNKDLPPIPNELRDSISNASEYSVDSEIIRSVISNVISELSMGTLPDPLVDSVLNMSLFPLIIITKNMKNIFISITQ